MHLLALCSERYNLIPRDCNGNLSTDRSSISHTKWPKKRWPGWHN